MDAVGESAVPAAALIVRLLLDEPFRGLDFEAIERTPALLSALGGSGTLVLLTTHSLETVVSVAAGSHLAGRRSNRLVLRGFGGQR